MEIIYTEVALEDLRRIPRRFAAQIVAKISRLEHGLRGDIKRLTNFDCDYRLRCGNYRVLFDVKPTRSSFIVSCTAKRLMIKTSFKKFAVEIARKRREMTRLQEDLADMLDHLAVIEARAKSANGKRYSTAEVKCALRI